ncbi:protein FAM227B-like [Spheniscus humboldti]
MVISKPSNHSIWRSLFLSKSSIALLQDSFWWWFLQKFKPNQEDQDHLFDRIADFVANFLLVPRDDKDAFFQVYPDCLSQVIYCAFYEAFPESIKCFDDDFKDGLVDLIFQWISVALLAVKVLNYCGISQQGYNHTQRHNL